MEYGNANGSGEELEPVAGDGLSACSAARYVPRDFMSVMRDSSNGHPYRFARAMMLLCPSDVLEARGYDTRVLVFDPSEESVVVSEQFDVLLRPLGDGWAFELIDTEVGDRKVRVGPVTLTGM